MIGIVDYGMGNIGSIVNMMKRIGLTPAVVSTPSAVLAAQALIIPGVGSFDTGMRALAERRLLDAVNSRVVRDGIPVLGLCLGMQLFAKSSEEGREQGFGWLNANVVRFSFAAGPSAHKVPHMGWAHLTIRREHSVLQNTATDSRYYFAHSYYMQCGDPSDVVATATYGVDFPAVVAKGNVVGLQYHPEKSHRFGMGVLRGFAAMVES